MAAEAYGDEAATSSKRPLTFLDLPLETQHEVLNHVCGNLHCQSLRQLR